jgi:hypothetical protein
VKSSRYLPTAPYIHYQFGFACNRHKIKLEEYFIKENNKKNDSIDLATESPDSVAGLE